MAEHVAPASPSTRAAATALVLLLAASLAASLSGCGRTPQTSQPKPRPRPEPTKTAEPTVATPPATEPTGTETTPSAKTASVVAYFLKGEKVYPTIRVTSLHRPVPLPEKAVEALLAGPNDADRRLGLASTIPSGTRLLGLKVANGTATVDLSGEFGSGGGSASIQGRVAQVVYTLTRYPDIRRVVFHIEGEPVEALGGEGLVLTEPQTRADYEDQTPSILVDNPAAGATVKSPLRIRGAANTFEAEFMLQVTDVNGRIVATKQVMATSGSGTRGTFDVSVPFTTPRDGLGEIVVWEVSAKDGSRIHIVETPIRMVK